MTINICTWRFASSDIVMPRTDGVWCAIWGEADGPDYISAATTADFDPPHRMMLTDFKYFAKTGPLPFQAKLNAEFTVKPHDADSVLQIEQANLPGDAVAADSYAACGRG